MVPTEPDRMYEQGFVSKHFCRRYNIMHLMKDMNSRTLLYASQNFISRKLIKSCLYSSAASDWPLTPGPPPVLPFPLLRIKEGPKRGPTLFGFALLLRTSVCFCFHLKASNCGN
uniref:Uncharacterized protein n=1 Tax=Corvus moneduloides TaxID=1196302 RepID=A0A8C3DMH0_CORMO